MGWSTAPTGRLAELGQGAEQRDLNRARLVGKICQMKKINNKENNVFKDALGVKGLGFKSSKLTL